MKLHPSITAEVLMDAAARRLTSLDNPGFCVRCGNEQGGCEPDARGYECESCRAKAVYGAEELLIGVVGL
jgi:hypothetical protein